MPFAKFLPREEQYFSLFAQMTSYINDAANALVEMLSHRDGDYQENEGDDIYQSAIAGLFHDTRDPLTVIKWKDVYERLEAAVDRCENVANIIEGVIIKHS